MIHKIVHIKNLGRYKQFVSSNENWDGVLSKVNAIYADNGSGKTTFTQLIKSLKGDFQRIVKRRSFGVNEKIDVLLIDDNHKQLKFTGSKWNKTINDIEVFDTYYIDSNVYLITLGNLDKRGTFFEIVVGV
ncbi:hypothetical protein [Algoriphagus halophytocola]|uniref:AAA family ATPase n=1 Tax=Algoriphagus halophytocola TaxID=2991499 RepID=A0ABY6MK76_9BACT|nr:hypothetical protein [Algoriphagus sp. TR-M5]UZD24182.1 hypothetical protein OM944_06705 [Algoriphagus sp. TR-M5]